MVVSHPFRWSFSFSLGPLHIFLTSREQRNIVQLCTTIMVKNRMTRLHCTWQKKSVVQCASFTHTYGKIKKMRMTVLMMMTEEWRWCGTSQHRNSMVWVVPGGRKMSILIPPNIHVDKKRSSSVFLGWSENEGQCCRVVGLKRRSPHNMEGVVRLDPLSQGRGLPCRWQGVKVPRKHSGHLCRQKLSMSWLWIQIWH